MDLVNFRCGNKLYAGSNKSCTVRRYSSNCDWVQNTAQGMRCRATITHICTCIQVQHSVNTVTSQSRIMLTRSLLVFAGIKQGLAGATCAGMYRRAAADIRQALPEMMGESQRPGYTASVQNSLRQNLEQPALYYNRH